MEQGCFVTHHYRLLPANQPPEKQTTGHVWPRHPADTESSISITSAYERLKTRLWLILQCKMYKSTHADHRHQQNIWMNDRGQECSCFWVNHIWLQAVENTPQKTKERGRRTRWRSCGSESERTAALLRFVQPEFWASSLVKRHVGPESGAETWSEALIITTIMCVLT